MFALMKNVIAIKIDNNYTANNNIDNNINNIRTT